MGRPKYVPNHGSSHAVDEYPNDAANNMDIFVVKSNLYHFYSLRSIIYLTKFTNSRSFCCKKNANTFSLTCS